MIAPRPFAVRSESVQQPRLISIARAAELLSISERHARDLARTGAIRVVRLGRRCLVPVSEIARIVEGEQ